VDGDGFELRPFDVVRFAAGLVAADRFEACFEAFLPAGFVGCFAAAFVDFFAAGLAAFPEVGFAAFRAGAFREAGFGLGRLVADPFPRPATFRPPTGFSRGAAFFTAFLTLATPPLRLVTDVARVRQLFGTQIYKWCNECQLKSSLKATSPVPLS
jgi:hypothetical protein